MYKITVVSFQLDHNVITIILRDLNTLLIFINSHLSPSSNSNLLTIHHSTIIRSHPHIICFMDRAVLMLQRAKLVMEMEENACP